MDDVADLAATVHGMVRRLRLRLLAESPQDGITPSQRSVLSALLEGPMTQTDLAARERVRIQSTWATVGALEELGLVARQPHPSDGRRVMIALTAHGRRLV